MKFSKTLLFLVIYSLGSCREKSQDTNEYTLSGEKVLVDQLTNPEKIRSNLDKLFVLESHTIDGDNPPIHILNQENLDYLFSMGKIGFGPGEISDANLIQFTDSDSSFFVYSAIDKKFSEFSLSTRAVVGDQVKQRNEFYNAYSVLKFTDSTFISLTVDSPARFVEFNEQGDSIGYFGKLEDFSDRTDLDFFNLSQINMGWLGSNRSRSYFANSNLFSNKIEILQAQSGKVLRSYLQPKEYMKFDLIAEPSGNSVYWDLSSPYQFRDIVLKDNYIFALYGGLSQNDFNRNSEIAKTIFVFDYEGIILAKLNLDYSINSLAVSDDLSLLYGISTDKEPGIVVFKTPTLSGILPQ